MGRLRERMTHLILFSRRRRATGRDPVERVRRTSRPTGAWASGWRVSSCLLADGVAPQPPSNCSRASVRYSARFGSLAGSVRTVAPRNPNW